MSKAEDKIVPLVVDMPYSQREEFKETAKYRCMTSTHVINKFIKRFIEDTKGAIDFLFNEE